MTRLYNKISYKMIASARHKQLLPLFFIIFIDSFGYFLIFPVLLRLLVNNEASLLPADLSLATRDLLFGVAIMLSPLAFLLSCPFVGNLSDRFGRKKVLLFCLLFGFIGFLLPILGIHQGLLSLIFIGRFISGAATGSQPVAQAAITDFSEGRRKAFYLALIGFAMTLAMVLGPLIGGYISDSDSSYWFGLATPYWFGAILALINIILLTLIYYDYGQVIYKPEKTGLHEHFKKIITILTQHKLVGVMSIFFFLELAWSQYYQTLFLFLSHQYHYSTTKIGWFTAFSGLMMSLGLTVIYKIWLRFKPVQTILKTSLVISTIGFFGSIVNYSPIFQWIFIIPLSICIGTAYPSLLALMSDNSPIDHQGLVLGVASTLLGLAWMITGFLAGSLAAISSIIPIIFASVFILVALMIINVQRFSIQK